MNRRRHRSPTIEQLLILANRAEDGPLTPAEAARLREGLAAWADRHANRGWPTKAGALRRSLHQLHAPLLRGGIQVCTHCSGWNGFRCLGLVSEWPCQTLLLLDSACPTKECTTP
ncbi:hypothetical protein AB0E11_27615 [Streptomyces fradiae]|uniref:hypothetical protein n=1 Tax=Streptomyces fradiae TaxID=1906 RepID=UPI0029427E6C|nr:hypothetical protein [Streptomyces fradiae]WOI58631.1 hypothetical protein RYQ63_01025 [Streptomyces fradiae]